MKHSPAVAVVVDGGLSVIAGTYEWSWSRQSEEFAIRDRQGRPVVSGSMQPGIAVTRASDGATVNSLGELWSVGVDHNVATFEFHGVNGDGRVKVAVEFYSDYLIQQPPLYSSITPSNVESMLLSAEWSEGMVVPAFRADYCVHPGSTESSVVGPVVPRKDAN